jgi:hypothetical protein
MTDVASPAAFEELKPTSLRVSVWIMCHLAVITSGFSWADVRHQQLVEIRVPPIARVTPLTITPRYDVPELVSDIQLQRTLHKLRPRLRHRNPQTNHVDHALRFWGVEARFSDPECYAGIELRDMLLDYRLFRQAWDQGTKPLMVKTEYGIRPRLQAGIATASHEDHTLACLAETGTPLDCPIITTGGEKSVHDLFRDAFLSFSLNQVEYEWSTLTFALYCPTNKQWFTSEGQLISFDDLAERIMRQQLTQGVCAGNHRLHTLAMLLRVHEQQPLLSDVMREKIVEHLRQVTGKLVANQKSDGSWDMNWDGSAKQEGSVMSSLSRHILATGHALEWWAFAPESVHPKRETLVKASHWVVKTVDGMSESEIAKNYTFLSHAGRSLALWRGKFPAQIYQAPLAGSEVSERLGEGNKPDQAKR